jgi:hypothetical protein
MIINLWTWYQLCSTSSCPGIPGHPIRVQIISVYPLAEDDPHKNHKHMSLEAINSCTIHTPSEEGYQRRMGYIRKLLAFEAPIEGVHDDSAPI